MYCTILQTIIELVTRAFRLGLCQDLVHHGKALHLSMNTNMKILRPTFMLTSSMAARSQRILRNMVAFRGQHRPPSMCTSADSRLLLHKNNDYTHGDRESESSTLKHTALSSIAPLVQDAHQTYASHVSHPYQFRIDQLRGIERLIHENREELTAAIASDLGQGALYCEAFELTHVINHVRHSRSHLKKWMSTSRKPTPFPINLNVPIHSELTPNPRGVALIITPWNMPLQMIFNPLVDALSAGNICVLKMSEKSVSSTALCTELLTSGKYLDRRVVKIVNGGPEQATELLKHRFDVAMFTGGEKVGRIVAKATAKHLTPTVSPTWRVRFSS